MTEKVRRRRRGTQVTGPDGTVYPSICAAADALGTHQSNIHHHLNKHGHLGFVMS